MAPRETAASERSPSSSPVAQPHPTTEVVARAATITSDNPKGLMATSPLDHVGMSDVVVVGCNRRAATSEMGISTREPQSKQPPYPSDAVHLHLREVHLHS